MGSSTEHSAYGADPQPLGPRADPGRLRRRLVRRAGRLPGAARDRHRHRRLDPAAGGGHRHRRRQADVRRRVAATASSRWRPRLDQVGPCARTVLDAALLHEVIGGHDPHDSTSIARRCPPSSPRPGGRDGAGLRIGVVRELGGRGLPGRGASSGSTRRSSCSPGAGAEIVEVIAPELPVRARGVLPDHAEPRRRATSPGSTACATAYGSRARAIRSVEQVMSRDPGRRVRRRGGAPHHPGHLRAVGRLLRRVLRPGAEGAHAHPARLRRRVRARRRARLPTAPTTAFRLGEQPRRPAGDVPQRRHDDPREPRGHPGHVAALRARA